VFIWFLPLTLAIGKPFGKNQETSPAGNVKSSLLFYLKVSKILIFMDQEIMVYSSFYKTFLSKIDSSNTIF